VNRLTGHSNLGRGGIQRAYSVECTDASFPEATPSHRQTPARRSMRWKKLAVKRTNESKQVRKQVLQFFYFTNPC